MISHCRPQLKYTGKCSTAFITVLISLCNSTYCHGFWVANVTKLGHVLPQCVVSDMCLGMNSVTVPCGDL